MKGFLATNNLWKPKTFEQNLLFNPKFFKDKITKNSPLFLQMSQNRKTTNFDIHNKYKDIKHNKFNNDIHHFLLRKTRIKMLSIFSKNKQYCEQQLIAYLKKSNQEK